MRIFPKRIDGEDVLKYIFPTKQKDVQKTIALAKKDKNIKRVIIFGSAITPECGVGSDLDLAIEADVSEDEFVNSVSRMFHEQITSEVDVIHYNSVRSELLKRNIDKGVCVYVNECE